MLLCKWDVTCGKILTHKKLSRFKNKIFMQIRFSLDVIVHVHFLDLIHDKISFIFWKCLRERTIYLDHLTKKAEH